MDIQCRDNEKNRQKCVMSNLPKDILLKILEQFPVHTLNDLRRVCPQWSNSILDPCFANHHLLRSEPGILILDRENCDTKCDTYVMEIENGEVVIRDLSNKLSHIVVASCNGLVLIRYVDKPRHFCVGNLLTKRSVVVPTLQENIINWTCHYYGLTFVPGKNEYKITASGFGRGGGKLITLPYTGEIWLEGYFFVCEILTVGSNAWRGVLISLDGFTWKDVVDGTNISVNGVLYYKNILEKEGGISHLVSMDMARETLEMIPLPKGIYKPVAILEIGGFMALADKHNKYDTIEWGIWSLRDFHKKEWVKLNCIITDGATKYDVLTNDSAYTDYSNYSGYSSRTSNSPEKELKFIGSLNNGRLMVFLLSSGSEAICHYAYDVEKQEMKRLENLKTKQSFQYVQHVNSLASC